MRTHKKTYLSKILVAYLALNSFNAIASCETLESAPDVDLTNASEDLQNKISKLEEIRTSLKQNKAELAKETNEQTKLLTQLKSIALAKTAVSTAMTVGSLSPVVAASPAVYMATVIANSVGVAADASAAENSGDSFNSVFKFGIDGATTVNDYAIAMDLKPNSLMSSTWSKLWSAIGLFNEFENLYSALNEEITAHDTMKRVEYQLANIDSKITNLKKGLEDTQKVVKKAEDKIGKDTLDSFKQAKSDLQASCESPDDKQPDPEDKKPDDANITDTGLTRYTKIANDGSELPDSSVLGSGAKDWACTKDNKTDLIWEVKTNDGGLHDQGKTYSNYDAIYPKCDWNNCEKDYEGKLGNSNNTDSFVKAVNTKGLCGLRNWRLPTKDELSITYDSNSAAYFNAYSPFWVSSSVPFNGSNAWGMVFSPGYIRYYKKENHSHVLLVHD